MIKRRDVDFGAACKAWGSKTNTSALYKRETSFAYTFRWKTCTLEFLFGACFVRGFLELELIVVVFTFKICCLFVHPPHPIPPHIYRLYPSIAVHKLPWARGLPLSGISLIALISQPDTKPDHKQWLLRAQIMAVSLQPESSLRGDKWGSRSCSWRVVLSGRELENDREKKEADVVVHLHWQRKLMEMVVFLSSTRLVLLDFFVSVFNILSVWVLRKYYCLGLLLIVIVVMIFL